MKTLITSVALLLVFGNCFSQTAYAAQQKEEGFADIKLILGAKKEKVQEVFGGGDHFPSSNKYKRPVGNYTFYTDGDNSRYRFRVSSVIIKPTQFIDFKKESIINDNFFSMLGLSFPDTCSTDTVSSESLIVIKYRQCSSIKPSQPLEDVSGYYYELRFVGRKRDLGIELESVVLILRNEND